MKIDNKSIIKDFIEIVLIVFGVFLISKYLIFCAYIPSGSMKPTLNPGDLIVSTRVYEPSNLKRGNIVIFNSKEKNEVMVKRLIGIPGDKVSFDGTSVYVNDKKLNDPYIKNNLEFYGDYNVPQGK